MKHFHSNSTPIESTYINLLNEQLSVLCVCVSVSMWEWVCYIDKMWCWFVVNEDVSFGKSNKFKMHVEV